ncbi:hypothetical protein AAF134_00305, partial [Synechococcus lacustris Tous-12m]
MWASVVPVKVPTKLLPRLYEPEKGKVLVDGMTLPSLNSIRSGNRSALFPKIRFCLMAAFSITLPFTNPTATQDEIDEAVEISCSRSSLKACPPSTTPRLSERGS